MLKLLVERRRIELDEKVTTFDQGSFGDDLDNADRAISSSHLTADLNVFATLNFALVEDLRDKFTFHDIGRDRVNLDAAVGLLRIEVKAGSNERDCHNAENHQRGDVATTIA